MTATTHSTDHGLSKFHRLLLDQVRHEFTASQQYIALAVWFDDHDLPQLARSSTGSHWRSATTR